MTRLKRWQLNLALAAGGLLTVILAVWLLSWGWRRVVEFDSDPPRRGLKAQAMRRKADAMSDVRDAMYRGRLDRVEAGAARVKRFATGIEGFIRSDLYDQYGEDFHDAVDDLQAAAGRRDREAAKEAVLRLERSCIDCHLLINPPEP